MQRFKFTIVATIIAMLAAVGAAAANGPANHRAHLTGDAEVPAVATNATGQAKVQISPDGSELSYRVNVANIHDVLMAHLHVAPAGVNGPVVVWLYPEDGPPPQLIEGRTQGTLATGTVTADDLVGPLEGATIADLAALIEAGEVYVNVHTVANPGGEVRGQLH